MLESLVHIFQCNEDKIIVEKLSNFSLEILIDSHTKGHVVFQFYALNRNQKRSN